MRINKSTFNLRRYFTPILIALTGLTLLASFAMAWRHMNHAIADEEDAVLYALILRAQSLGWAVEAAARLHGGDLAALLQETSQQPGISFIALVNENGQIVLDSNSSVVGRYLYTAQELKSMEPTNAIKGRFSPDDGSIFETWRIFNPGRLRGHRQREKLVLFIGLDASIFQKALDTYRTRLLLETGLLLLLVLCSSALAWFAFHYHISRRNFENTRALAEQIIGSYPSPLLVTDLHGQITFVNEHAKNFFAIQDADIKITSLGGLPWEAIIAELVQDETVFEKELICHSLENSNRIISFSDAVIRDGQGQPQGWLFVLRDLTQIKNLQRELAESQRFAALGHMAAGVAHEIRNPLSSIRGYAGYLRQRLADNVWAASTATLLEEEAIRLDRALSDLLLLSKKPHLSCAPTSLRELLHKLQKLMEPEALDKHIQISLDMPVEDAQLEMDRDRMLQALLNIALNAVEATATGGRIELGFHRDKWDARLWIITIRDNGRGITPADLEHIFTPYFTTRAEGTGLGLTITRQIVEAHGGRVEVSSVPGQGAVFNIYLPGDALCQSGR